MKKKRKNPNKPFQSDDLTWFFNLTLTHYNYMALTAPLWHHAARRHFMPPQTIIIIMNDIKQLALNISALHFCLGDDEKKGFTSDTLWTQIIRIKAWWGEKRLIEKIVSRFWSNNPESFQGNGIYLDCVFPIGVKLSMVQCGLTPVTWQISACQ